ncbi:SDR family NAD(P)-dependent oxidoreductase [Streptomyces sp. NPDC048248]|uniref:SDR family NAD(P)-dependent oxidoreductase n=1 Tax=Streptomyces sp. NPDC048248 TaxID=3365523 RepID=UPI00371C1489
MSRAVLVTGASRGIGRAVAERFAAHGDRVALHYGSRREAAEEAIAALEGSGHVLVQGDVGTPEGAAAVVEAAVTRLGGIDVLVNNAATNVAHPLDRTSFEDWHLAWRQIVDVNLLGAAHVSYGAARNMIERAVEGRIIHIGSRGAYRGEPDHPAYGATKAALHAMGQSLAVHLAPHGIAVASVAPGFVATERVADRITDGVRQQSPFGRVASPEDVAAAVHYLASPEAVWSSGTVLDVNGASHLR